MPTSAEDAPPSVSHALDRISLGRIVQIRERLLAAQAAGTHVFRFESGDPSFAVAPHVHHSIGSLAGDDWTHVVSVFSFSTSHAMSGLRAGYLVTRAPLLRDRIPKLLRCTINGVNSLAQAAALAALWGDQSHLAAMRDEYHLRRDLMVDALAGIPGVHPFTPHGAFYVWAAIDPSLYHRLEVRGADELSSRLAELGIGSAPDEAFGECSDDAIRFSFSCGTAMVREGCDALRRALA